MGNLIIAGGTKVNWLTTANIVSTKYSTGYEPKYAVDLWHLKRNYMARASTLAGTSRAQVRIVFASSQKVAGIILDDVNFNKARIRISSCARVNYKFGTATGDNSTTVFTKDPITNRYKAFIAMNSSRRYIGVCVSSNAAQVGKAVGLSTSKWSIGRIMVLTTYLTLSKNMNFGYKRTAGKEVEDINMPSGARERVSLSSGMYWTGTVNFDARQSTQEGELWIVNAMDRAKPIAIYENSTVLANSTASGRVAQACYICTRDNDYEGTWMDNDNVRGTMIKFSELG